MKKVILKYIFAFFVMFSVTCPLIINSAEAESPPYVLWTRSIAPAAVNSVNFGKLLAKGTAVVAGGTDEYVYLYNGTDGLPIRSIDLRGQFQVQKIYVDVFRPDMLDILVVTSGNWILLDRYGGTIAKGLKWDWAKPEFDYYGQWANLLNIGDYDGDGYKNVLYYIYWASYELNDIYVTKYPIESLDPRSWERDHHHLKGGEAVSGWFSDVDLDGDEDAFFIMKDGYLYRYSGNTELYRFYVGQPAYYIAGGDLDNDRKPDILVGRSDGNIRAVKGLTGQELWTTGLPEGVTSLLIERLTNDNVDDIVTGCKDGFVYALNGSNGQQLWSFNAGGSVRANALDYYDWNGDGTPDIVAGSIDGNVYVIDGGTGNLIWKYNAGSAVYTVKVGDINDDDLTELVLGTRDGRIETLGPLPPQRFEVYYEGEKYYVNTYGNSTISNFQFNQTRKEISFDVSGLPGTIGFCNITIPKTLLWCDALNEWSVTVNGDTPLSLVASESPTHTSLYFTYMQSAHQVKITGTQVIPEFPSDLILPLLMISTFVLVVLSRKKRSSLQKQIVSS